MKLGICTTVENIEKAAAYGFDYIEIGVASVSGISDQAFEVCREKVLAASIKVEAANGMLPGSFHVTGEKADHGEITDYVKKAFPRLAALGCRIVVFGSGGARRIPDGYSREAAWKQMVDASGIIADIAAENGITIALEPLNTGETNIINSVAEGGRMVEDVNHPAFKLLADYYHIGKENEGFDGILSYARHLRHTHIAHPITRRIPQRGDGGNYESFFAGLAAGGYDGRVSIEGRVDDFDTEVPFAVAYLKSLFPGEARE